MSSIKWDGGYANRMFRLYDRCPLSDENPPISFSVPSGDVAMSELLADYDLGRLDPESNIKRAFDIICREYDVSGGLLKAIVAPQPPPRRGEKPAVKHDAGKLRWTLLPMRSLQKVIDVLEYGAKKYAPNTWKGIERGRYVDAAFRHMAALADGEKLDPESGLPHAAHAACCMLFVLYFDGEKP